MTIKTIGALFILIGCGSVGFKIAANYIKEEKRKSFSQSRLHDARVMFGAKKNL